MDGNFGFCYQGLIINGNMIEYDIETNILWLWMGKEIVCLFDGDKFDITYDFTSKQGTTMFDVTIREEWYNENA